MLFRGNFHIKQKASADVLLNIMLVEKYFVNVSKDKYGGKIFEHVI